MPDLASIAEEPRDDVRGRIGALFGVTARRRHEVLAVMLRATHDRPDRVGYWFQLLLATGIATLGLVLESTGVVIGAMLVAPLMGPIVHLAMGLVIGSSVLALHAAARVAMSVATVIAGAGALTMLLPFQETTREITARASPTALDLGVAAFCALAGGFSTIRPGADTAATAAGTSIGISLVPPLCVVGFALGTRSRGLAEGAGLLFVTNLSAILFFCALYFAILGFRGSDSDAVAPPSEEGPVDLAARGARSIFGREYGVVMRIGLPLILLALIFAPLRRALTSVTWEVRTRAVVRSILSDAIPSGSAVQSHLDVARGHVSVRVVMVDRGRHAQVARAELTRRIAEATGVAPDVEVVGVPDLEELRAVAATTQRDAPVPEVVRRPDLDLARRRVEQALVESWPPGDIPPLAQWRLELARGGSVVIEVRHEGEPLGAAAVAMLSRDVSSALGTTVFVRDVALGARATSERARGQAGFIADLASMVDALRDDTSLRMCVVRATEASDAGGPSPLTTLVESLVARADPDRVRIDDGDGWSAALTFGLCTPVSRPEGADAGAPSDVNAQRDARAPNRNR